MKRGSEVRNCLILLLLAVGVLSIFSTSSFLYAANPWSDANVFFTIGRGIVSGKRMYIDLFDHKGPLTYWLYALAALISSHSFIGVFVMEVAAFFLFLLFTQKTVQIYRTGDHYLSLILLAIAMTTGSAFNFGGGSVEEYALPAFTGILMLALRTMQAKKSFSVSFCIWTGIALGFTFFLKFSMCGFFAGLAIAVILYQWKVDQKKIFPCIGIVVGTFVLFGGIICLILYRQGIFDAFVETYFTFNLTNYAIEESRVMILAKAFTKTLAWFCKLNFFSIPWILLASFIFLIRKNDRDEKFLLLMTFLFWYGILMIGGRVIYYYIYPIYMYSFLLILELESLPRKKLVTTACAAGCAVSVCFSRNITRLGKQDIVQNELDAVMKQYTDHPTLLMYHAYDEGFYLKEDYIPSCRYFTVVNTPIADFDEVTEACITSQRYDFLITSSSDPVHLTQMEKDGYELLEQVTSKYYYDDQIRTYSLYIRQDLLQQN